MTTLRTRFPSILAHVALCGALALALGACARKGQVAEVSNERMAAAASDPASLERHRSSRVIARVEPAGGPDDMAGVAAIGGRLSESLAKYSQKQDRVRWIEGTPLLVVEVPAEGVAELRRSQGVRAVVDDFIDRPFLLESIGVVDAADAWNAGAEGNGQTVVVLDTGIQRNHPFFAGRLVGEACFSSTVAADGATSLCPDGSHQQVGAGAAATCAANVEGCGHGTHVAGIAAGRAGNSSAGTLNGVGRGADIVAIQVFSRFDDATICDGSPPCALTYTSDQIRALQHVRNIVANQHAVAAINMSLGGGFFPNHCDGDLRKGPIDALRALGIATVIASGNEGFFSGIGAPACISSAVSVGSTTKSDGISGFSNSATTLDLLAPGSSIRSSVDGTSYGFKSGTSMATPHVAGAFAALKSQDTTRSVDDILTLLEDTGLALQDPRNGVTVPRIDLGDAANGTTPACTGWWCGWWPW